VHVAFEEGDASAVATRSDYPLTLERVCRLQTHAVRDTATKAIASTPIVSPSNFASARCDPWFHGAKSVRTLRELVRNYSTLVEDLHNV